MIRDHKFYCNDCGKELGDDNEIRFCKDCCVLWLYAFRNFTDK
jgi:hypothetical protein